MKRKWLFGLGALWILLSAIITIMLIFTPPSVTITWQTETEFETAGFNILRSVEIDGVFSKINQQLIVSRGKLAEGGIYKYRDDKVDKGNTYYYRLEEVELDNNTNLHGPLVFEVAGTPIWQPALAIFSAIIGIGLVSFALRNRGSLS